MSENERGRTESRWKGGRSEIRVLVFYSQDDCWDVKCEADVAVWSDSSWKALAAAAATCWLLIENSGLPLGNRFPFLPEKGELAESCFWIDKGEWVLLALSPFCGICGSINTASHLRPQMDCVCNNCTFSEQKSSESAFIATRFQHQLPHGAQESIWCLMSLRKIKGN